jgi:hypothetical protein
MSNHFDPDRSIARWLVAEAPDRAPERLLEASRAQVSSTAQRRSLRLARRIQAMNSYAKLGIAAAAVLVVAVAGITLGPGLNVTSSAPSQTSAPLASPSALPSVAPPEAGPPKPPVEFTGTIACGPPVRSQVSETIDLDDGTVVARERLGAWQQTASMSDPRLEGAVHHTYEADVYRAAGADADGPTVIAFTWRITNDGGVWETRGSTATFPDGSPIGDSSGFYAPSRVFVGSGGYEGLVAILEVTEERDQGCVADVRGMIFEGAPVPDPYVVE